jgi:hypothetical protein
MPGKNQELIHVPWWGWILVLAVFYLCAALVFIGLFSWGIELPS